MDVFQQNWTEGIKNDKYVNLVLNSDRWINFRKKARIWWWEPTNRRHRLRRPGLQEFKRNGIIYEKRFEYYPGDNMVAIMKAQQALNPEGAMKQGGTRFAREKYLNDNTRPQTLYNLNYPSLR